MLVQQAFYGRGMNGYEILGASFPSCGLTDQVLDLCRSVGTPGFERQGDDKPFLLQKKVGPNVLMACGRNGEVDSLGRKTLFFHVLVIPHSLVLDERVSAYDLFVAGVFSESCKEGSLSEIQIQGIKQSFEECAKSNFCFPSVVLCKRSDNLNVAKLFNRHLVGANWATINWGNVDGFDWCGLEESRSLSSIPGKYTVYDNAGNILRSPVQERPNQKSDVSARQCEKNKESNWMKFYFCLGGIIAGLSLGRMIWCEPNTCETRREVSPETTMVKTEPKVASEISELEKQALRQEVEASVRKELEAEFSRKNERTTALDLPVFDERFRITDFFAQMKEKDPMWQSAMIDNKGDPSLKDVRNLFKKIQEYVEFVNLNFPASKERKK